MFPIFTFTSTNKHKTQL